MSRTVSKHPALGAPYGKQQEDQFERARQQAQAQFESIREMVEELEAASEHDAHEGSDATCRTYDEAGQRIQEDALSVEVRTDWQIPTGDREHWKPAEYRILLCTGGPAVQITGTLNAHGEPETARLEMEDWFLPWTEYRPTNDADRTFTTRIDTKAEEILLTYARQFYFGE